MGKFIDLTGQRFGKLVAIKFSRINEEGDSYRGAYWECLCDCGNLITVAAADLKRGDTKSCGCLKKTLKPYNFKNLKGQRFERLMVIDENKDYQIKDRKRTYWNCLCDCGNICVIQTSNLLNGNCKSCGCLQKEYARKGLEGWEAPFNQLFSGYRRHAKDRKLSFELSREEFKELTQGKCHYCGCEPSQMVKGKVGIFTYNGVDRINSDLGYKIDNCVSCCGQCNKAKMAVPQEEFLLWIDRVHAHIHRNDPQPSPIAVQEDSVFSSSSINQNQPIQSL